ncbi:hypothetical protein AVEN_128016-1 [Araneus ventricosus]|uniref:Uncharacterized protein n=1 Tax=Araneus ventricosus TaxID=182803 RepID=A0A4Y2A0A9_ARAVE|nr:hypothetical protein AVEN_128016-1 [Araneus ventricosus]
MMPSDFKYGRKQETVDEEKENVILMEESEDEDCGSFQREMEEVIYLESFMVDFSTNLLVLLNVGGVRIKNIIHTSAGFKNVEGSEYDMTGLRTTNLAKSKFISMVQFAISESQLKDILPGRIVEVDCREDFQV